MSKEKEHTKLLPELRFSEFGDEWEKDFIGNRGEFTGGGTPSKRNSTFWIGEIPWVSSSDISEDSIHTIKITRFISEQALKESATKKVPGNSLLIVSRVGVGKVAVSYDEICTSQDFTNFTPAKDDLVFLGYYLKTKNEILLGFSQGMAIKGFTKEDIYKLNLLFPKSIQEQQKIANTLSSLDHWIGAENEKLDALQAHKKGLLQQLFPAKGEKVPVLRFGEFEGEWEETTLGQVSTWYSGGTPSKANKDYWNGDIPWISAISMRGKYYSESGKMVTSLGSENGTKKAPKNSILLLVRGSMLYNKVPVGITSREVTFNQDLKAIIAHKGVNTEYLYYWFSAAEHRLMNKVTGTGIGAGKLETSVLKNLDLYLPPPKEQQKIASCLSSLDDFIAAQSKKIEGLQAHKKGLMQQMFPNINERSL